MIQKINNWIYNFQEKIFSSQFQDVQNDIVIGSEFLFEMAETLSEKELRSYNDIISNILDSLQKTDYLLLADLLEYRLKPFLQTLSRKNF